MVDVIGRSQGFLSFFINYDKQPPRQVNEVRRAAMVNHPEHAGTGVNYINPDSAKDVRAHLAPDPQRGVASTTMMSANAPVWLVQHSYHSGEPQRAFLEKEPPGGKLSVNVTITPSGHDGFAKAQQYASENTYVARVGFYDKGNPKADYRGFVELEKHQFDGDGKPTDQKSVPLGGPRWAATSPNFEVDLNQFRKDNPGKELVLQGWPSFSAGVGGYVEARETFLKV